MNKTQEALRLERALKLALEALEVYATAYSDGNDAITAIREALAEESSGTEHPAQQDIPDLIAGAIGVSRGTAYDLMREALAEQPAQDEDQAHYKQVVDGVREAFDAKRKQQPAQQQQEPVLWQILNGVCHAGVRSTENMAREAAAGMQKAHDLGGSLAAFHVRSLYTSPPASKLWVGLTTDDRKQLLHDHHPDIDPVAFFEATEAKLKEKNA